MKVFDGKNIWEEAKMNKAIAEKESGLKDFYGYYRITAFWPTLYY